MRKRRERQTQESKLKGLNMEICIQLSLPNRFCLQSFFFYFFFSFLFVVNFVIHWNETAMGLHVFPIPIPPVIT